MKKMLSIGLTEIKLFLYTPLAYIISFAFYTVNGVLFWYLVNQANTPGEEMQGSVMSQMTGGIVFWLTLLILIPVFSMRLIAFENERKTLQHLFSSPVGTWQITLGKFSGAYFLYVLLWLPTLLYQGLLCYYSHPDTGPLLASYLGVGLIGSFALSIGLFASSLSKNQISAAVMTFSILMGLLLLSMFEMLLKASWVKQALLYLNFVEHFTSFSQGLIDTRDVVYFFSGTLFFLVASNEVLNYRRLNND
ncbi:MAG: ABC transporter permease [Candidatus Aureabacteria bacterium]|nr:ABC transporter permease [Candidatus Auribacterota bacterium]